MQFNDTTIITPTLNEEKNIGELIRLIIKNVPGASIIVSDDGSKDDTRKIVDEFHKVNNKIVFLDHSKEKIKGLTASVIDGVKHSTTKYVVVIDSDLQHPPEKIPELIAELRKGKDVVIGTRKKVMGKWAWNRKLMSKTAIILGRISLMIKGIYVKDVVSGFFGIETELFKKLIAKGKKRFVMKGYKVLFDILKQLDKRFKFGEVYYVFGLRKSGSSKIKSEHIILYLKSLVS